ncbi:MAG: universal stress protein [Xanthobacteraceae bacterium]
MQLYIAELIRCALAKFCYLKSHSQGGRREIGFIQHVSFVFGDNGRSTAHGRHGMSAIVLGSETVKVLTHCKIPVLVHR